MAALSMTMNRLSKQVTLNVEVRLTRQFHIRKWLGISLIKLAARVLGCGIEISTKGR